MVCPRCGRLLLRAHDTGYCLVHGTVYEPERLASDAVESDGREHRFLSGTKCDGCGVLTYRARFCVPCADRIRRRRNG